MDIRKIKKLIDLVKETGVTELEIQEDKERVRITYSSPIRQVEIQPQHLPVPNISPNENAAKSEGVAQLTPPVSEQKHTIKSPMVGTVYLSASPGTSPFVEIGRRVKSGEVVCLIEAMKMFNRIEADKDGVIKAKLVENEQPVEFGQPLFVLED